MGTGLFRWKEATYGGVCDVHSYEEIYVQVPKMRGKKSELEKIGGTLCPAEAAVVQQLAGTKTGADLQMARTCPTWPSSSRVTVSLNPNNKHFVSFSARFS